MAEDRTEFEVKGLVGIAWIENPTKRNALGGGVLQDLAKILDKLEQDRTLRFLIISGKGENFCSGMDVSGIEDFDAVRSRANLFYRILPRIESLPMPVLAAVRGITFGGGFELALSCDMIMASDTAVFSLPEAAIGGSALFAGMRLAQVVGRPRAKELLMTCRRMPAAEADKIGLVNKVVPDAELMNEAMKMAEDIAKKAPIAIEQLKLCINRGLGGPEVTYLRGTEASGRGGSEFSEGVKAMFERRPPQFKGR